MIETTQIQQAVLEKLQQLSPEKQQEVLNFVDALYAEDISEEDWLHAASRNPVFEFLHDSEEDIYTLEDGKPIEYEG
jgi:hypothetical protein